MTTVCIFCGSSHGDRPEYAEAARDIGHALARANIRLVYGGAHVGLMGIVADTVLAGGGDVVGVITEGLQTREVGHRGLPDLRIVQTMHERKAMMASLADGFVALPGGAGTLDEFFEAWTWTQLGIHRKPVGLMNVNGYFDPLLAFLDRAVADGFIRAEHRAQIAVSDGAFELLELLARVPLPPVDKWIERAGKVRP